MRHRVGVLSFSVRFNIYNLEVSESLSECR